MLNITVTFPVIALCYQPLSNVPLQIRAMVVLNHRVQKDTRVPSAQLAPQITFSFNRCLECPSMLVRVFSCVLVIVVLIFLFLLIFWGGSNAANGERGGTEADVAMSCVKVVVGFYQVASGIFSAVLQVQWPVVLVSMEKYLKFVEGNNSHHWPHQPSVSTGSIHAILSFYLFQYLSNSVDTDVLIT